MVAVNHPLDADVARALAIINVVAYVVDREGTIVWQNHASRRFIGDVLGTHFTEHVAPEDRRRAIEAFTSKVVGNVAYTDFTVDAVHASGARTSLNVSSVPLYRDGELVGVLGMLANPPVGPRRSADARLTPRQLEVLRLIAEGKSTSHIAKELHIATETVRNHIRAILGELDVHSRVEAVAAARASGLLEH